jgi:hypothetical protein
VAILAGALAGCGSSNTSGTTAEPADAVPASAVLYVGATVRPKDAEKTAALKVGRALTHQADPYLRLLGALQTPGSAKLSFSHDVAPWLGTHAGMFLTSLRSSSALLALLEQGLLGGSTSSAFPFGANGAQGAIVLDTSNAAAARSFLDAQAARAGAHATSYMGVAYQATSGGVAFGLIDRFAVIGSESGLRSVIETTVDGGALAHASGYVKLLTAGPARAIAHIFYNPPSSTRAVAQEGLSGLLGMITGTHQANISLVPSTTSLSLDADTLPSSSPNGTRGLLATDPEGAQALDELPGESWLAIGLGNLSATLEQDAQDLQGLASLGGSNQASPAAGLSLGSLLQALITPLRELGASTAQARRDFASWMGSGGVFASGANLLELRAAVVISSKSPTASRAAVAELASRLRMAGGLVAPVSIPGTDAAVAARLNGLPVTLDIADGRGAGGKTKFVLGLGEASVASALNPTSTLSGAAARTVAAANLTEGIQPSLIVDFPTLVSLLEAVGFIEDPPISKFAPYLRSAATLAGGGHELGGEVERFRLVLGLQQPTG